MSQGGPRPCRPREGCFICPGGRERRSPVYGHRKLIANWVRKRMARNIPMSVKCKLQWEERSNYLVALSQSAGYLTGFDPVVRTNTSTSNSTVSGTGTVTDNYGGGWNYVYNGNVDTTTTTRTNENVPYTITSKAIYANAYDDYGALVSYKGAITCTVRKSGGDTANSLGYNMG